MSNIIARPCGCDLSTDAPDLSQCCGFHRAVLDAMAAAVDLPKPVTRPLDTLVSLLLVGARQVVPASEVTAPDDWAGSCCDDHDGVDGSCTWHVDVIDGGPLPLAVDVIRRPGAEPLVVIDQVTERRFIPAVEVPAGVARQLIGLLAAGSAVAEHHAYDPTAAAAV